MRVLFMGTPAFAVPTLRALLRAHDVVAVATRPDKGRGRGRKTSFSEVKACALEAGVPVEQPTTLREAAGQDSLAGYGADVFVVAAYGLILPPEVLETPPLGCLNVHASLLPRHRGAAPIAWAILEGDRETGITTMLMDEGLDTGPILLQRGDALHPRDTAPVVSARLAEIGAELMLETLAGLEAGELEPRPQPPEGATLAPSFRKSDGALEWNLPARAIDARVRALQPWPGTFTFRHDERLSLWEIEPQPGDGSAEAVPGTVLDVRNDGIRVACAPGEAIDVVALQRAGGRRQPAAEFVRGRPVEVGERWRPEPA